MYTYIRVRLTCTLYILWHELFYFSVSLHALYTNQPEHVYVCIYRAYNTINKMLHTYIHTYIQNYYYSNEPPNSFIHVPFLHSPLS